MYAWVCDRIAWSSIGRVSSPATRCTISGRRSIRERHVRAQLPAHGRSQSARNESFVPKLSREDGDERLTLSDTLHAAVPAAPHQLRHGGRIEYAYLPHARRLQLLQHVVDRLGREECRYIRGTIGLLGALQHGWRDETPGPASQDVFLPQPAQLAAGRQGGGKLEHAVIEERKPSLDPVRERHAIP